MSKHRIVLREATDSDVLYVGRHLRRADVIELELATYYSPQAAVIMSAKSSVWTTAVLVDDVPAILFGVSDAERGRGVPWMLATNDILKISREFIEGCHAQVERMQGRFPFLINQVHCRNTVSIRWLRWLGFTVDEELTGPHGLFRRFWKGELPDV